MKKWLVTGSFDPITIGHMDIIKKAAPLCDKLVIGIIVNPKKNAMFTLDEKLEMIRESVEDIPNAEVTSFSGLLADYVKAEGFDAVVRGLRNTTDFDYEFQMADLNERLYSGFRSVFFMSAPDLVAVSSTNIKEIFHFNGDIKGLVPEPVYRAMMKKREGI